MKSFKKELLENDFYYVDAPLLNEEVEKIIALQEEKKEALMVFSGAPIGKYFAFKGAINKKEGNKIFINFNDLSYMSSFPSYYVVKTIYEKLDEFGIAHNGDFPNVPRSDYHLDVESNLDIQLGVLKKDLYCLKLDKPLYILIGNCDMPFDNDFSLTFYRHFIFDKRELPHNLHVFLITSSNSQAEVNKEFLNVIGLEGCKDNPKLFFKELLKKHNRSVDEELLLLANPSLRMCDYIYIAGYAINYCGLNEYKHALKTLLTMNSTDEILLAIFNGFYSRLSPPARAVFTESLLDLYIFNFGLTKDQIINSGRYLLDHDNPLLKEYEEISIEEKEIILNCLVFFTKQEGDRFIISDRIIREFIGTNAMYFTNLVCQEYKARLLAAVDYIYKDKEYLEKIDYRYSSEEYMGGPRKYHLYKDVYLRAFEEDGRFLKKNISRFALFKPLSSRLKETIKKFNYKADKENISEDEILMISYIERASIVFQSGFDYMSFYELFENESLMYFLLSKSRRMVRRILKRFIDTLYEHYRKVAGGNPENLNTYSLMSSLFSYLDKNDNNEYREELLLILGDVLSDNDVLENGFIKDFYNKRLIDPVSDFVRAVANSSEVIKDFSDLIALLGEKDVKAKILASKLEYFVQKYDSTDNVYHKLIYAYLAFKAFMALGEKKMANPKLAALLDPILEEVLYYAEYCYFPELYGMIYALFGRFYPKEYLERMITGIDLLKAQGYQKVLEPFVTAFRYFASLRIKEEK